jgi:hypothetical protein
MALWPFGTKEKATLSADQRAALTAVVRKSKFEIIPLKGIQEKSEALPAGATVTVTASPAKGIDRGDGRTGRVADARRPRL